MKSVIRSIAPDVTVVDLTHEIPRLRRAGRRPHARAGRAVPVPRRRAGGGRPRRRHRAAGGRRRGRRRAELPRRPRQRAARAGAVAMVRRRHRGGRAHQPRLPAARAGPHLRRPRRVRPRRRPPVPRASPRRAGPADRPAGAAARPAARSPATRTARSSPRCCGSTATATASSTSTPTRSTRFGPRVQLRWGDDVRTADRAPTYEGIAPGEVGLVVDSYGLLSICLGKRSAADELAHRRRHRGDPVSPVRRRRARRRRPSPSRRRTTDMRPGTTLVLAILLALILGRRRAPALLHALSSSSVASGDLLGAVRPAFGHAHLRLGAAEPVASRARGHAERSPPAPPSSPAPGRAAVGAAGSGRPSRPLPRPSACLSRRQRRPVVAPRRSPRPAAASWSRVKRLAPPRTRQQGEDPDDGADARWRPGGRRAGGRSTGRRRGRSAAGSRRRRAGWPPGWCGPGPTRAPSRRGPRAATAGATQRIITSHRRRGHEDPVHAPARPRALATTQKHRNPIHDTASAGRNAVSSLAKKRSRSLIGRWRSDSRVLRSFSPAKASAASTADTISGTMRNSGASR